MAKTVFDVLDEKLAALSVHQEEFITSGGAKTLEGYREACGVIRGLTQARRELQDLAQNYRDGDND
tara:strand:- start:3798 stop:3995 length:198 start_codon:yes stop_codon:yes gene_type:complete